MLLRTLWLSLDPYSNPKSPPAARQAAASSLLDRAWGKPASLDLDGAEQLVIRVVKFGEQLEENNMKVIEHNDEDDKQETN
jgi:hypothetical protein